MLYSIGSRRAKLICYRNKWDLRFKLVCRNDHRFKIFFVCEKCKSVSPGTD